MSIITIWNILNNNIADLSIKRGIEIPMIQRDYAQGRDNNKAEEIRKVFLNNLVSAIDGVIKDVRQPLELDFIYGYIESEMFIPLDGQQRLTTLYLLHWYLAFKDQQLENFKIPFSKFSYQTRQSSGEFLKSLNSGLSANDYDDIFNKGQSFKAVITNKNWYFVSWKYDLTIQSAITMLDDIHTVFNSTVIKFADLISEEKPCVIFNFLDIRNFGLSDDLYIKMNSRGKPLTNFENLKAELGKFIEESAFNESYNYSLKHSEGAVQVNVETYFVTKIDTEWTNYFWAYRNKETNEFDDKLLNLLAFVALNEIAEQDYTTFDSKLKELDKSSSALSYYKFQSLELLNESSIISYIDILDLLVNNEAIITAYFQDKTFLAKDSIINYAFDQNFQARYEQRVLFYAVFEFLSIHRNQLQLVELTRWDRLIRNLVANTNTIYNTPKDFQDSILSIKELITAYNGDIYETFLNSNVSGFDKQQIKEEKLKIKLMASSEDWKTLILEAESHGYLKGQIMFLLAFSGIYKKDIEVDLGNPDENYYTNAKLYFDKFCELFKESGLRDYENDLFRRALLTKGDYLLYSTNCSFIIDSHRDISWKRLLKESGNLKDDYFIKRSDFLKNLFDDIDINQVEDSLKNIIKAHTAIDWRKDFIEHPTLMKFSYQKYIKFFDDKKIYILRNSKYSKYQDPEVKSLLLRESLVKNGFLDKDIELGFIEDLQQYGINRIKHLKPKIVYNHNGKAQYLFRQKGKEDLETGSINEMVKYITENF